MTLHMAIQSSNESDQRRSRGHTIRTIPIF